MSEVANTQTNVPAIPSNAVDTYLNEHCGGGSGVLFKFAKDQRFRRVDDGEEIPLGTQFTVVYDQMVGWIKFNGKGEPPERKMGALFQGFLPPPREELGDMTNLSGRLDCLARRRTRGNSRFCYRYRPKTANSSSSARPASPAAALLAA
jgi:hypothetical protein